VFQVPSSNAGQGSQCRPVGLGHHVGPLAISRKFPAIILGTESHGGNSKEQNYPHPHDYSLYCEAHQRISQPPQEITRQAAQPNSRPATWAVQPPTPAMPPSQMGQTRAIAGFPNQTGKLQSRTTVHSVTNGNPVWPIVPAIVSPMLHPTPRHDRNSKATQRTWPFHRSGRHQPSNVPWVSVRSC